MDDSKACTKCGVVKLLSDFHKSKRNKSGYVGMCKSCDQAKGKAYYAANSAKVNARTAANKSANPEKAKATNAAWHQANKVRRQAAAAEWRKNNPEKSRAYTKAWELRNPGSAIERNRRKLATARGKLENVIRAGFLRGITSSAKAGRRTFDILGYTADDVKAHIEKQFLPGMSWDNHGRGPDCWHIDHKIPLSAHNYETPYDMDFKRAWALSNLQPLWEFDNLSKNDSLYESFQPSLPLRVSANDNNCLSPA